MDAPVVPTDSDGNPASVQSARDGGGLAGGRGDAARRENLDEPAQHQQLSQKEMEVIRSLDSRSFGFLDFNCTSTKSNWNGTSSAGANFVSKQFIRQGIAVLKGELTSSDSFEAMHPQLLCQIGHLHLLVEDYPSAFSAYQQYSMVSSDADHNPTFLYGLALIYFSYGRYDWSIETFRKVLSLSPDFARLSEIYVRLGMMHKSKGEYSLALEDFSRALHESGPCSISKLEIQFHLGHLHHLCGEYRLARQSFECILASKNVPDEIKALSLRQLGWLYHTVPQVATPGENPHAKAIELLNLAVGANPTCSQAWYFLGRCHADQGNFKNAFLAYRQSVSKSENQSDTWCAIGILYQQMGQARDSLQAYITGLYLSSSHYHSWTDLGLLYESCGQLIDAFLCYKNGQCSLAKMRRQLPDEHSLRAVREMLTTRLNCLEQQIHQTGGVVAHLSPGRNLPSLYEAWNTLVPQHLRTRYPCNELPLLQFSANQFPITPPSPSIATFPLASPGLGRMAGPLTKKQRITRAKDPIILKNMNEGWALNSPSSNLPFVPSASFHPSALPSPNMVSPLMDPLGGNSAYSLSQDNNGFDSFCSPAVAGTPLPVVDPFTGINQQQRVSESTIQFYSDQHEASSSSGMMRGLPSGSITDLNFLSPDSVLCSPQEHDSLAGSLGELAPSAHGVDPLISLAQNPPPSAIHEGPQQMMVGSHSSISEMLSVSYTPTPVTPTSHSMMVDPGSQTAGLIPGTIGVPTSDHVLPQDLYSVHPLDINTSAINMEKYLHSPELNNSDKDSIAGERSTSHSQLVSEILKDAPLQGESVTSPAKRQKRLSSRQSSPSKLVACPPITLSASDHDDHVMINMEHNSTRLDGSDASSAPTASLPNDLSFLDSQGNPVVTDRSHTPATEVTSDRPHSLCLRSSPHNSSSNSLTPGNLPLLSQLSTDGSRDMSQAASDDIVPHVQSHTLLSASGNASDSSSGISSARTKLSSSLSPSPPPKSPPSPPPAQSLHSLPCFSPEEPSPGAGLLSPISEPCPGLGDRNEYMRQGPLRPPLPPYTPTSAIDFHPQVPVYEVKDKEDAMSERFHAFCTNTDNPISLLRGLVEMVGFDLELFSTRMLVSTCSDHVVEVREQVLQAADENWDPLRKKMIWKCESNRSDTSVKEYGEYQDEVSQEQHCSEWSDRIKGVFVDGGDFSQSKKLLRFGTNCDLSDSEKWSHQLDEINKLPKFLRVMCPEANFLNHVGHTVLGMNSVQLYMKVPGCRTPGHQENNNFCSVNVNIGPGDCEWFGVANRYWGVFHKLCEKHKISFLVGSWWPILDELKQKMVPVYRFVQRKGEVVWINPGTVHWVQANSVCNNIAWNVGPLTAHQFRMAWERYQWNKIQKVRSIVPMISMCWNVARGLKLLDGHLRKQIHSLLQSSYRQCDMLINQLRSNDIPIMWHGKVEGEPTPTCATCLDEVFNVLFVSTNKKGEHLVYCHKCVQQIQSKTKKLSFTVLQQYSLSELKKVMDAFQNSAEGSK